MDQADYEEIAGIGERPVGNWRGDEQRVVVHIPVADDSPDRDDPPIHYNYDTSSGRITLDNCVIRPDGVIEPLPIPGDLFPGGRGEAPPSGTISFRDPADSFNALYGALPTFDHTTFGEGYEWHGYEPFAPPAEDD